MEYFAIYAPSADTTDAEEFVFEDKALLLQTLKNYKDARFKSFKGRGDALKFARNGTNPPPSLLDVLKSPPPNVPPIRSLEKSNFAAPKSQDLVKFRKEIEQNNLPKVYEMINMNPRYLVSSGDTPSILKEGPRYNALHVAAMNKHDKMAKLILQTVEQTKFIELLHGIKNHPNAEEMSQFLLESYLNTPDKSRNETPLHFASKIGAVEVIKVLISYPLCKMKPNSEGLLPKDIICSRLPDGAEKSKLAKEIEELLEEKFFVPVLRSNDSSVQAQIGKPFSPANMPKFAQDPMSPTMEIKAYAGPMTKEQAQTFHKRLKTPPRLTPTGAPSNLNLSFSPKSSSVSSPFKSPRMSKSLSEIISSTPKHKKKLFGSGGGDEEAEEDEELYLDNINGNHRVNGILNEHEEEEFKEILEDLMEEKMRMEAEKINKENIFRGYRNPEPMLETPIRGRKNDTNSNHLNLNFNSSDSRRFGNSNDSMFCNVRSDSSAALMTYLDESGSVYNSDTVCDSPSFKEKHIRLTDIDKGLEKIGRELAMENNIGWKEFWTFLGRFLDIRSDDGLQCFESFLKQKEKFNEPEDEKKSLNDSFGLGAICAGFNNLDLNDESSKITRNGLTSPSTSISRSSLLNTFAAVKNVLPLSNPYSCLEQSCRTFSKRLLTSLESETIQDQHSYEKILLQEANKLNTTIDSYKRDMRFSVVNFQKVHARYCFLLVSKLKKHNSDVKYLRAFTPLISKVYALASQYASQDASKVHAVCLSRLISGCIEKQEKIFSADSVDTETACVDAWNGPDIVECSCSFDVNLTSVKHRREIRKKLYSEKSTRAPAPLVDVWARRIPQDLDDEDLFLSCSDDDSDDEKFFTPPTSPTRFFSDDEDDMNTFEESLESFEDEKDFHLFIEGDQPTKTDQDVLHALGENFPVDESKYPLVHKWHHAMKQLNAKARQNFSSANNFRIFTPKLKLKGGFNS